jgi:hypothetical protein
MCVSAVGDCPRCAAGHCRRNIQWLLIVNKLFDTEHHIFPAANSPLLNTIAGLEEKVFSLERQNESLSRSLRQKTEQMVEQKGKYELEKELARKSQDSQREINALREEEMARMEAEHLELHM